MTGNGRNLTLVHSVPEPDDGIAWVPIWDHLPWRDETRDLKPTETELEAS